MKAHIRFFLFAAAVYAAAIQVHPTPKQDPAKPQASPTLNLDGLLGALGSIGASFGEAISSVASSILGNSSQFPAAVRILPEVKTLDKKKTKSKFQLEATTRED